MSISEACSPQIHYLQTSFLRLVSLGHGGASQVRYSCVLCFPPTLTVHREHLYRRHRVPIQCKRCWQTFKTGAALDAHLTVINICPLQAGETAEGLTSDQEKRLKSRKKSSPDQGEEARWKEIYGILFPNEVVPNPCEFNITCCRCRLDTEFNCEKKLLTNCRLRTCPRKCSTIS
jgi:hypothetical protein